MKTRFVTNDNVTEAQEILLEQKDAINDQYDAIEIIKAFDYKIANYENKSISRLHSDRTFKKILTMIGLKNYICVNSGTADSVSDMVSDDVRFYLGDRKMLSMILCHTHTYRGNIHDYTLYMSIYKIDYDFTYEPVCLSELIKKITKTYKLDEIMDSKDNKGSSRKRQ